ncbi:10693_t:CDS:2 [Paraglomus occultum]|uniref:10693_t:CDS:1 n=1 Tax=Paraglomus occultum TaxID=144539 RepID=A0A9N8WB72_9GLOM|nr:10693_t:CDS:2 [Paraglomus occultum]
MVLVAREGEEEEVEPLHRRRKGGRNGLYVKVIAVKMNKDNGFLEVEKKVGDELEYYEIEYQQDMVGLVHGGNSGADVMVTIQVVGFLVQCSIKPPSSVSIVFSAENESGILGFQVAGRKFNLYVLIRDHKDISCLFLLRSVDIPTQYTDTIKIKLEWEQAERLKENEERKMDREAVMTLAAQVERGGDEEADS